MYDSSGKLTVRAYTAGGALPVEGAVVRIMGATEENRLVAYSLITDRDGVTEVTLLPAPSISYSLSPDPAEMPYALYDIEITAPGYYSERLNGVSVFSGISSVQPINMIPGEGMLVDSFPLGAQHLMQDQTDPKEE